tara:strand:+ start:1613 stop:2041 length:429 start_codon:yes stop_codon:yes gene_type:complete
LQIKLVTIGKIKENIYRNRIYEYLKWINNDIPIEIVFLKNDRIDKLNKKLLSHLKKQDHTICISEEGAIHSSKNFSKLIHNQSKDITFFIGGHDGHSEFVKRETNEIMSLSLMTFPQELALLILVEQIYRGISIFKGSKYHR